MPISVDSEKIAELLNKGTSEVIIREDLEKKLKSGKQLKIKLGIDPTGADLHLGHMVVVKKLQQFQDLGHQIILIFGNFTGQIGDPSGKSKTRDIRTQEALEKNAQKYLDQVKILLDTKNIEIKWNADWLAKLTFKEVVQLASNFTVMQMLERDMFQERIKKNLAISLHEFLYPLMQGYDSVALQADVELGGTDQTFNLLAGRALQRAYDQEPQNILTVPILEGLDGHIKMGKSEGNYIGVSEDPINMYGKVMSIPDSLIIKYFELCTKASINEIATFKKELEFGKNPRDLKMILAQKIVTIYHNQTKATEAENHFINIFQKRNLPEDIPEVNLESTTWNPIDLLITLNLTNSKSEARRLIEQGALEINAQRVLNHKEALLLKEKNIIQVGKRKFVRVKVIRSA